MEPTWASDDGTVVLFHADCMDVLPQISGVSAVVTDPPYMMGAASTRRGTKPQSPVPDWTNAARWYADWIRLCLGSCRETAPLWMCGNLRGYPVVDMAVQSLAKRVTSTVVWDKDWIGVGSMAGLRSRYELMFLIGNEDFAIKSRSVPDIWVHPWSSQRPTGHPSEKPVGLFRQAIEVSEVANGSVLDPFMGSGTAALAAIELGCSFIGIELDQSYFDKAQKRIEGAMRNRQRPLLAV